MPDSEDNYHVAGMHGGCKCDRIHWVVIHRLCNYSAFNGYHRTSSAWSRLRCKFCRHTWRTKAGYVRLIPDAKTAEDKGHNG